MARLVCASGIGPFLQALYLCESYEDVQILYFISNNSLKNEEFKNAEVKLVREICHDLNLIDLKFGTIYFNIEINKVDGSKRYTSKFEELDLELSDYSHVYASTSCMDFFKPKQSKRTKYIYVSEGYSSVEVSTFSYHFARTLLASIRKYFRTFILNYTSFSGMKIDGIYFPLTVSERYLDAVYHKNLYYAGTFPFQIINVNEFLNWCEVRILCLQKYKPCLEHFKYVHIGNKYVPDSDLQKWLKSFGVPLHQIIIKPHPSDFRDFSKIASSIRVLDDISVRLLPAEVLGLSKLIFLGWYTSALLLWEPSSVNLVAPPNRELANRLKATFSNMRAAMNLSTREF